MGNILKLIQNGTQKIYKQEEDGLNFGTIDENQNVLDELPNEEIDKIMKKIGYINSKEDYLESAFERLNLSSEDLSLEEKLNKLFSDKEITEHVSKLKSGIDIFRFYRRAIKEYIPESDKIAMYGGYSKDKIRNGKKYTILVDLEDNNNDKFWVWSNRQHQMKSLSNEFIAKFIVNNSIVVVPGKKYVERCQNMLSKIYSMGIIKSCNEHSAEEFFCR